MKASRHGGIFAAVGAFVIWGLFPAYWKALGSVSAGEIMCHRVVWSAVVTALALAAVRRFGEVRRLWADRRTFWTLCASGACIAGNWFLYIWAVNSGHVVECSLGYYINPLVNVLLGVFFLGERPRAAQWTAIGLAGLGVAVSVVEYGSFPWIALTLGVSFGFYGLIRKTAAVEALPGLFFETALLAAPAALYVIFLEVQGTAAFGQPPLWRTLMLMGAGVGTSLPLVLFAYGARRVSLATLGVAQYVSPTCMFLLGVFVYGEPFGAAGLATFACIWAGALLYLGEGMVVMRRAERVAGLRG